jgi:hypothetical protein
VAFYNSQIVCLVENAGGRLQVAILPSDGRSNTVYRTIQGLPSNATQRSIRKGQLVAVSGRLLLRIQIWPEPSPEAIQIRTWKIDLKSGELQAVDDQAKVGDSPIVTVAGTPMAATTVGATLMIGPLSLNSGRLLVQGSDRATPHEKLEELQPFGLVGSPVKAVFLLGYSDRNRMQIIETNSKGGMALIGELKGIPVLAEAAYQWTPSILALNRDTFCLATDSGAALLVRKSSLMTNSVERSAAGLGGDWVDLGGAVQLNQARQKRVHSATGN